MYLIVDVVFYTMSDFNVPGSRPKKTRRIFGNRPYILTKRAGAASFRTEILHANGNEWYLTFVPSQPKRYINIKPLLCFIPIKVHRVFLSYNIVGVSSHHLIFDSFAILLSEVKSQKLKLRQLPRKFDEDLSMTYGGVDLVAPVLAK